VFKPPSTSFLSLIIAFESAVIALAIPVSIDIVSRISQKYQSNAIAKKFLKDRIVQIFPLFTILNIAFVVCLMFRVNELSTSDAWNVLAWIAFIGFAVTLLLLVAFWYKLKRYMVDDNYALEKFLQSARRALK
jgi:hypothetical protein